ATLDPTIGAETDVDVPVLGASSGAHSRTPSIAFDGTNYLVVWADTRLSTDEDVFGTLVNQSGAVITPAGIKIGATAGKQTHPVVAFAGGTYVVAWEDFKVSGGAEADIAAATVNTAGTTVTSLGAIANTATSETTP